MDTHLCASLHHWTNGESKCYHEKNRIAGFSSSDTLSLPVQQYISINNDKKYRQVVYKKKNIYKMNRQCSSS